MAARLAHYRSFWGAGRLEVVHWTPGHLGNRLPDFHIVKVRPQAPGEMWVFASIGAWRATADEAHGLEFVVAAREPSAEVMQHLATTAYYHAGSPENRLGVRHLVALGEGWVEGSSLESILISQPYPWGPGLEHCQLRDRHIQVLWVLPITAAEHQYARDHGVDVLEEQFEKVNLAYLDPFRPSVV